MQRLSRVRTVRVALAAALILVLTGCGSNDSADPGQSADPGAETRVVTTDSGEVTVPADPQRILVLNSSLTGYFFALGRDVHASIALTPTSEEFPEDWADEAEEAGTTMLPWSDDGFNVEAILAEEPDLIVGGGQGFPGRQGEEIYDQLTQIAPTVMVSTHLVRWQEQLGFVASDILADAEGEQALVDVYASRVAEVKEAVKAPPTPVGFLVMTADKKPFSLPETSSLAQLLQEIGIEPDSVLADHPEVETYGTGDSFEMTPETLDSIMDQPTIVVLGFNAETFTAADLAEDPIYAALPAFEQGSIFDLPYWSYRADYQTTIRLLDVLEKTFGES